MNKQRWFSFTTRELVAMAILVAAAGVIQVLWAQMVYNLQWLGPFSNLFGSFGFNIVSFGVLYLVRKPGAATVVKLLAGVIELAMGSPVGPVVIFYNLVEGFAADLAFVLFKGDFSFMMVTVGSILAWLFAAPVDAYRDAVPMTLSGIVGYFGPGGMGKVWISLWVYLALLGLKKAGVKPITKVETVVTEGRVITG
ncbi:ECF transporter S component [candidate division WWE3 bacterium]|uniref:ECF transporter S component n=1 Tax=candidate division WWE3 bacterium TaxID=2053526 RepID=A0A7X9HH71_UNCKA|nr:ECF transporter S component [candidate division WWE3 bacterium]